MGVYVDISHVLNSEYLPPKFLSVADFKIF